ncbi:CIC11C00000001773 [Sungouiella intermedia]|uniref:CIC11C00000001773 n=1 Tax=Sungouiella intermedia TaxID=45354 RepID=A0A1L0FY60_9ASCO|nr:CIC11C00000001773 [[Candida] intermedia]SGZ49453.1 CIC11C00000006064 [[Candida] intermedia]
MTQLDHVVTLNIPFETARQASIACKSISVDPVLKKDEISVDYEAVENIMKCTFAGVSDRVIRVAISNAIDNIKTIVECMDEFDGQEAKQFE